jgi:membrane fusion protein (multidrug efflux system)
MRSIWSKIVASILLIVIVGGFLWLIVSRRRTMDNAPVAQQVEMPEAVGVAIVEPIETRASATAIGTVLAPRSIQLRTELVGLVSAVSFSPGQIVEQDQILVQFDTSVEKAQLASAQAMRQIAESTYKRSKQASDARAISELELEQSAAMFAQADAEVMRLEAIIQKKTLRAPFRARAGLFDLHPGQYLPEGTAITMLQGIDPYAHIDFMMPQQVADFIKVGDCIFVNSEAQQTQAIVIAIDSQADKVTRNVMARAKLDNPPASLQPNDSIRLEMKYGPSISSVKIPFTALRSAPSGSFVYVAQADEKDSSKLRAVMKNVSPGASAGQFVTIGEGLKVGETVVTDGSFKLRDGVLIVPVESKSSNPKQGSNAGPGSAH